MFHPEFAAIYTRWFVIRTNALPKLRHGAPSGVERMDYGLLLSRGSFLRLGIRISILTTQAEPPWRISFQSPMATIRHTPPPVTCAVMRGIRHRVHLGTHDTLKVPSISWCRVLPTIARVTSTLQCSLTRLEGRICLLFGHIDSDCSRIQIPCGDRSAFSRTCMHGSAENVLMHSLLTRGHTCMFFADT